MKHSNFTTLKTDAEDFYGNAKIVVTCNACNKAVEFSGTYEHLRHAFNDHVNNHTCVVPMIDNAILYAAICRKAIGYDTIPHD